MNKQVLQLSNLMGPVVEAMGYEFVGVECLPVHGHFTVRVYIDSPDGILMEDCTQVSRQLSGVLEVEDPIESEYMLEISSPGVDRPLFSQAHFERFVGEQVKIKLIKPFEDRRNFTGLLKGWMDENVVVEVDGEEYQLPHTNIEKARLIPDWSKLLTEAE
ncbi:MAG: ribosome maturation factor RimP [Pseudomonadota bacterium]